ncbi:MAG: hypothetical protein JXR96_25685 [Deltaproteobacteria bacterium]|nr:hypothetical protein [Deltaproteobacteria bacterium]
MKLPIALQTALERSERAMDEVLAGLGLDRGGLARAAEHIRARQGAALRKPVTAAASRPARRGYHV